MRASGAVDAMWKYRRAIHILCHMYSRSRASVPAISGSHWTLKVRAAHSRSSCAQPVEKIPQVSKFASVRMRSRVR